MNNFYLTKNLKSITTSDLAARMKEVKKQDWLEIQKDNFIIKKRNRWTAAYDLKNPVKESLQIGKQKIYRNDCCTVLIGMGLGHLAYSILKHGDKGHKVIIVEPLSQLIEESFKKYDFSEWLRKGWLMIAQEKEEIAFCIGEMDGLFVIQDWVMIAEKYTFLCEEYSDLLQYTVEIINQERCNTGTVMGAGSIIAENDIKNLPYCIRNRGIVDIKDLFKGKPAVTVNTGPSLAKNIHLLKDIQDNVIIVAVAQALRVLLAYDIKPDFICTVDYGEVNYEHFKGIMESDVPLIALNRTYAPILKEWQGPKFITVSPSPGFENTTAGLLYEKGNVEAGGSVSHLAFGIAHYLGCNPITTIGLDLAYSPDLKSHIPQVDAGGQCKVDENGLIKWNIKDPRSSLKDKEHVMGSIQYVPGYFGDMVPTNLGLASFITAFERIYEGIQKTDKKIMLMDSTEGGAKIKGSLPITLQKYIDTYCKKKIDKSVLTPFLSLNPEYEKDIIRAQSLLKEDIKLLEELIDNSEKGMEWADKMLTVEDKESFEKASSLNAEFANKAHELAKGNALIGVAIFHASRKIYSREYIMEDVIKKEFKSKDEKRKFTESHMRKNRPDLEKGVRKSKLILKAAKEAAEKLKPMYQDVLDIFNKYIKTKDDSLLFTKVKDVIDFTDAEKYLEAGNWAHVYVDFKRIEGRYVEEYDLDEIIPYNKALKMKEASIQKAKEDAEAEKRQDILDYLYYVEEAQKAGRGNKDFKTAIRLLKEAEKLFPKKFDARWGLATAYFQQRNMIKTEKYFEALYEDFTEIPRIAFEYGLVMLEKNNLSKAVALIQEAMSKTSEFNYFHKSLGDLYCNAKLFKEALQAYEEYKKYYPADYSINNNLMECYKQTGKYKKVQKLLK